MRLSDLLADVPGATLRQGDPNAEVTGVGHDSRRTGPGHLFVVMPGLRHDARQFVPQALARGAVGVVAEASLALPSDRALVVVPAARPAFADLATAINGHPSRQVRLVGVTGTDGKTSTTRLLAAILDRAGQRTGWLTTVDVKIGDVLRSNDLHHTTPEADRVQEVLAEMVRAGVETALLEVSSHALALDRVRGCDIDTAIFTNLSPEHLNFHGTMGEYAEAKARLFAMLGQPSHKSWPRFGVLNADDPYSEVMRRACRAPVLWYGLDGVDATTGASHRTPDVLAREIRLDEQGAAFTLVTPSETARIRTRLLGRFNVSNWLAAATAALGLGATVQHVAEAAAVLPPVPGRMERIDRGQPFLVVVDFAHTPQALENALRTLRPHTAGALMVVFGHAGERDPASRPAMGRIAADLSDFFILSMDDPIHEDPTEIAQTIAAGATARGRTLGADFAIDVDRASAIRALVRRARPGDTILLAGKGHEPRMLIGDERVPWSDRGEASRALAERGYDRGRPIV
ncbi:MAG: UDP-N-acetylmuramoyl-L-alanyl-D-glutamate--2,6-diaminopimelate ligase [Chloroflexi bacterium]|nr:UDP-N-acetylmuramoyl-L-alanyl-D-glutamate--2,6-diaminopimelate ligase [Chloroflexota bacterium]